MSGNLSKIHFAIYAFILLASSLSGPSFEQSMLPSVSDTPSQRWLPPPKSYPNQPDSQAKLLSRLRDILLNSDPSQEANSSRLSDNEVQSLKEAMKQFGGNLPDGLSADSLDAIPADLISKALSNPELMRQAKEMAEQFSKLDRPKSASDQNRLDGAETKKMPRGENNSQESKQTATGENGQSPKEQAPRSEKSIDGAGPKNIKGKDFAELMEKLRNTQQQFERGQNQTNQNQPPKDPANTNSPPARSNKGSPKNDPSPGSTQTGTSQMEPTPSGSKPSRPDTLPSPEKRLSQPSKQSERGGPSPSPLRNDPNPFDSKRNPSQKQPSQGDGNVPTNGTKDLTTDNSPPTTQSQRSSPRDSTPSSDSTPRSDSSNKGATGKEPVDGTNDLKSTSSMDIRKELDRRGFGPTLQKLVEDAQRASQSSRVAATPSTATPASGSESASKPTKRPFENIDKPASPSPSKRPSVTPPKPFESTPKPTKPDSYISKNLQEVGKYFDNLWNQVSKTEPSTTRTSVSPLPPPQASSSNEAIEIPNPFNARVLEFLAVIVAAGAIAFFVLRYRFRSEQVRREILEAQLAPRIDEIRTRDDVVRAFHAMAKQRFQAAQAWWTYGHVTERLEHTLPEHMRPIRFLSNLYEQARYFPSEHQLTARQIEDAKFALKQCKG